MKYLLLYSVVVWVAAGSYASVRCPDNTLLITTDTVRSTEEPNGFNLTPSLSRSRFSPYSLISTAYSHYPSPSGERREHIIWLVQYGRRPLWLSFGYEMYLACSPPAQGQLANVQLVWRRRVEGLVRQDV